MFTSILCLIVGGCVHFKVHFAHEPPVAVLKHAFMGLDTSVNYHMLIKLALEAEFLTASFTDEIFIFLMFIYMLLERRRYVEYFITVTAQQRRVCLLVVDI